MWSGGRSKPYLTNRGGSRRRGGGTIKRAVFLLQHITLVLVVSRVGAGGTISHGAYSR
jgi:hypothetical protein